MLGAFDAEVEDTARKDLDGEIATVEDVEEVVMAINAVSFNDSVSTRHIS